jgi:hypothetical protein
VEALITVGLIAAAFAVLLATFAAVTRFGPAAQAVTNLILILLALAAAAAGPLYDLMLWPTIQCLATIVWFVFFRTDAFRNDTFVAGEIRGRWGALGPLSLCAGVIVSVICLFAGLLLSIETLAAMALDRNEGWPLLLIALPTAALVLICAGPARRRWVEAMDGYRAWERRHGRLETG